MIEPQLHTQAILCLNAGSSSLKFALFPCDENGVAASAQWWGKIDGIGLGAAQLQWQSASEEGLQETEAGPAGNNPTDPAGAAVRAQARGQAATGRIAIPLDGDLEAQHGAALIALLAWIEEHLAGVTVAAVAHRVVHGGRHFAAPVVIDDAVFAQLEALVPLAPLHQPHNLRPIRLLRARHPDWLQVACFDTAFHRTQPWQAQMMPLPRRYWEAGVRRYGFHGLSYAYVAGRLPEVLGAERAAGRVVVAHLGNGASMCALHAGQSVASTMGFTALDGLMMGTRCGTIDVGVALYLLQHEKRDARAIEHILYRESGLLGVSELSSDMRTLLASDDPKAVEAVELFCYRAARELGSLAAALQGLDALVFTGGIGEHAAAVRARIAQYAAWLGVAIDDAANAAAVGPLPDGYRRIEAPGSRVAVAVVATNEEAVMAKAAWEVGL
ncbi:acetate/propionate family kinase [Hydrogenophilus thiooxidans]|uniref:acetate/propionate family kinase n=1 Tax=Hydrogenophilus thiooxidans TaxID=2820326 RepID=UPI001C2279C8|nr:acetate/propionate family kinase [Hydrogenophilus thiooxidans]